MKRGALIALAFISAVHASAKPPRAVPVAPPKPTEENQDVPMAVPVAPPSGFRSEIPLRETAPSGPTPAPAPVEEKTEAAPKAPVPAALASPSVTLPKGPAAPASLEDRQFGLAEALAAQQQWDAAIPEYVKFVEQYPASRNAGTAYFRLAEAHLKVGNHNSARMYYGKQLASLHPGPHAGIAAYRLGQYEFQEHDYVSANAHYRKAADSLDEPNVKRSAQYFMARSLQALGRRVDARNAYQPLADSTEPHPFREASQFQLALLLEESGTATEALARFQKLGQQAQNENVRAESVVRAAQLLLKTGDAKKALPALEAALGASGTEEWRLNLRRAVLDCHAVLGNHEKVIEAFGALEADLQPDQLPDALAVVANANRQLKRFAEALRNFERLLEIAPDSAAAKPAKYERLACLYHLDKTELPREVDMFLAGNPSASDRDNAQMMKAEFMRVHGDPAGAAEAYARVVKSKELKPQRRVEAYLRLIDCGVKLSNDALIIDASTQFLLGAGAHGSVSSVLESRAYAYRRTKNLPAAEKDFRQLLEKHPKFDGRSAVMFQVALLRNEQNDNAGMVEWLERLLKEFPEDPNAADAHHWIGWAAYEARDYKKAVLHLPEARKRNPEKYFEKDSLRLIYSAYNLNDVEAVWGYVRDYLPKGSIRVPSDLLRWCAKEFRDAKTYERAESASALLCEAEDVTAADWLDLGKTRIVMGKFESARSALESFLKAASLPAERSVGFIEKSRAELGLGDLGAAQKSVEEALRLQPEGRINAEARLMAGDVQLARKEWETAAKTFASVAVFLDDDQLSPMALEKSHRAYKEAGKTKEAADMLNRLQSRYPEYAREHVK